eukprot:565028-Hanusia_phi.AAC.1
MPTPPPPPSPRAACQAPRSPSALPSMGSGPPTPSFLYTPRHLEAALTARVVLGELLSPQCRRSQPSKLRFRGL